MRVINFLLCKFHFQSSCTLYVYILCVRKVFVHFLKQNKCSNGLMLFWWVKRINLLWCCVRKLLKMLQLVEIAKKKVNVAFYNFPIWNENLINAFWRFTPVIYGVSRKSWYKRSDGDRTRKNKSKKKSNILSFETRASVKWPYADCKFPAIRLCPLYVLYETETYQMSSSL